MDVDDNRDEADYRWQDLPPDMPPAIRAALEPSASDAAAGEDAVRVVRGGTCIPWPEHGELLLEEGRAVRLAGHLPADLPLGYHQFVPDRGQRKTRSS